MRRRLRKKFCLGEFRELGFSLTFSLRDDVDLSAAGVRHAFFDRLVDLVEARGCGYGGACGRHWCGFVSHLGRGSVTAADRRAIRAWLIGSPDVAPDTVACGPLRDANHGWDPRGKLDHRHRRWLGHVDWELAAIPDIFEQHARDSRRSDG